MLNNSIYGAKFATNPQALASRCAFHSINNSNLGFKKKNYIIIEYVHNLN